MSVYECRKIISHVTSEIGVVESSPWYGQRSVDSVSQSVDSVDSVSVEKK